MINRSNPPQAEHQHKNTPREAVLPLYCSSSAQRQSTTPHIGLGYYTTTMARTSINLVSLVLFVVSSSNHARRLGVDR